MSTVELILYKVPLQDLGRINTTDLEEQLALLIAEKIVATIKKDRLAFSEGPSKLTVEVTLKNSKKE